MAMNDTDKDGRRREPRRKRHRDIQLDDKRHMYGINRRKIPTRRESLRIYKKISVRFQFERKGVLTKWDVIFLQNLSAGGALFKLNEKLERGALINFMIKLPDFSGQPFNCKAKVVYARKPEHALACEIAVSFTEIERAAVLQIKEFIKKFNL